MITIEKWESMSSKHKAMLFVVASTPRVRKKSKNPEVFGFGINDADYQTRINVLGRWLECPAFRSWKGMIKRCYSKKFTDIHKSYQSAFVCSEWRLFSNYRDWYIKNHVDGFVISKQLIDGRDVYSPEACLFVPQWLNTFTNQKGDKQTNAPVGTYFDSGCRRYRADCGNPITGKQEYIGYFKDPEMAHAAWRNRKLELALELKPKMDSIDLRIYPRVVEIINNVK